MYVSKWIIRLKNIATIARNNVSITFYKVRNARYKGKLIKSELRDLNVCK